MKLRPPLLSLDPGSKTEKMYHQIFFVILIAVMLHIVIFVHTTQFYIALCIKLHLLLDDEGAVSLAFTLHFSYGLLA